MADLHLAPKLALPDEAVTQKFGFIGRSGSGKTYAAGKLTEQLLAIGAQVIVLDVVGVWWGLRLAANGKDPGIPIPVFGGDHGDIPLEHTAGALVARTIVERGLSVVLDVSLFRGAQGRGQGQRAQFMTDFAEELLHLKKRHRSAVHVVVEEAQTFIPQRTKNERLLGAMEDLAKIGRNYGIGHTIITQRPQAVSKEVLNQVETLFVFQTTGPHERKAIEGWIVEKGLDRKALVDELPSLPIGTAWLWSPQWLGRLERVKLGRKETFDASETPKFGARARTTQALAAVDLERIRQDMAATIERASQDDPRALRKQIAGLERELRTAKATSGAEDLEAAVRRAESAEADWQAASARVRELEAYTAGLTGRIQEGRGLVDRLGEVLRNGDGPPATAPAPIPREMPRRPVVIIPPRPRAASTPTRREADGDLPRGEHAVLTAACQYPEGVDKTQISILTGYKRSSRDAYLYRLRERGLVEVRGALVVALPGAEAALGDFEPLPTGAALRAYWLERLPVGERVILQLLLEAYPAPLDRETLSDASEYKRSSRDAYIQRLKAKKLVEVVGREIRASDVFFDA